MIAIVDVGLCNAGSIANMLRFLGVEATRTADPAVVQVADALILPGIGSFDVGRQRLDASGLVPVMEERIRENRVPILGICLGMQLMTKRSEEGVLPGFGWVDGITRRFCFPEAPALRVPHMGWNLVTFRSDSPFATAMPPTPRFYFVHSYHLELTDDATSALCHTTYGYRFASGFSVGNIHGVQFHPEKSHKFGLQLLQNFAALQARR